MDACRSLILFGVSLLLAASAAVGAENDRLWAFNPQGAISSSPALSPDGQTIYVGVENRFNGGYVIALNRDGTSVTGTRPFFETAQPFSASPAVGPDGTVYIGCEDFKFYALQARTGVKLWEVSVGAPITSSAAIAEDGTIYFGADDGKLHAVSPTGRELWTASTGDQIWSSPAIGPDGTIYFGSFDRKLYAISPAGREKWTYTTGGKIVSSPAIGPDGTIYIGSYDQSLHAVSPEGAKKWEYPVNGIVYSSPVVGADGTIYLGADVNFFAINPDGSTKWKTFLNSTIGSTAAIRGDGVVIFGADDHQVHALNPDGSPRWTFDTQNGPESIESSPIIGTDGTVYVGSFDVGRLYALRGNGSLLSTYSSWPAFRRSTTGTGRALAIGTGQLLNISARAQVGANSNLIAGLVITGTAEKAYLLRGIGPTLSRFGVANPMADPQLEMFSGGVALGLKNDNWGEVLASAPSLGTADTADAVGAFPLPAGSKDAALVAPLGPGSYTAHVSSVDRQSGVALLEVYDARGGDSTGRIVNLSTRGQVGTGDNILIPGVVVAGSGTVRLLIRAVGPGLAQFGVSGFLARPTMTVFSGSTQMLGSNTGWTTEFKNDLAVAAQRVGAFALADTSADCALILNATAGNNYTIQVSGVGGTTGEALVEIYVLP